MFCTNCGAKLEDNVRFCSMCGTPVRVEEAVAEPVAEETITAEEIVVAPEVEEAIVAEEIVVAPEVEEEVAPTLELLPVEPESVEIAEPIAEENPVEEEISQETATEEQAPAEEDAAPITEEVAETVAMEPLTQAPEAEEAPAPEAAPEAAPAPVAEPENKPEVKKEKKAKKEKPAKKAVVGRKKPHILLRILMQMLSFVLCIVLAASLVATVALADLNHIMSKNGIQQLVNAIIAPASAPQRNHIVGAAGVVYSDGGFTIPDDMDLSDIPEDILSGGDSEENISNLISWIYEEVAKSSDKPLTITEEQVQEFVQGSTITGYISEKLAGYAEDFINNTENTTITTEEIMAVLEENEKLIEETFQIEITAETKQSLESSVEKIVVEQDINNTIREQVFTAVEDAINESVSSTGKRWEDIQPLVKVICSDVTLYVAIGVCVLQMLLLMLLNFYNIPGGLTWISIPCIIVGGLMTLALALAPSLPSMISGIPAAAVDIIASFTAALLPIHAFVPILGVALLIISIIWRAIRSAVLRKRSAL